MSVSITVAPAVRKEIVYINTYILIEGSYFNRERKIKLSR